ncbi:Os08g0307501 [Oryza sativa Japonica Group]|uniref:Os08g0307501 protein n=1 Tax=Oryza sativa subsp. japonica TaxID=39947 RepID=A0A0N7KPM5_ORYSJ|nr:Os08g0307501 [Oryza sativa Japonica Group]
MPCRRHGFGAQAAALALPILLETGRHVSSSYQIQQPLSWIWHRGEVSGVENGRKRVESSVVLPKRATTESAIGKSRESDLGPHQA